MKTQMRLRRLLLLSPAMRVLALDGLGIKQKMPHLRAASAIFIASGGDKEIRTLDPLLAKQVLYQLSYTPFQ